MGMIFLEFDGASEKASVIFHFYWHYGIGNNVKQQCQASFKKHIVKLDFNKVQNNFTKPHKGKFV